MSQLKGWHAPDRGALFVVSGPSGAGKSTLLKGVFARVTGLSFSISVTTRPPRPGERDGVDYHFVDADRFGALRDSGALLEHAEVYGTSYGTPREPVLSALQAGRSIVLDVDVQGAARVRVTHPDVVTIFILPPTADQLRERLTQRRTDPPAVIERRMREAASQIVACGGYDYLVLNDHLETATAQFEAVFLAELSRVGRRQSWVRAAGGSVQSTP